MVRRQVERKLSIKDGIYDYEYQVPIELEYYVLESKINYKDKFDDKKVYGIGIAKKVNETCYEESVVKNLSSCISEVKSVINKLADNEVTPISLESILDDLLGT